MKLLSCLALFACLLFADSASARGVAVRAGARVNVNVGVHGLGGFGLAGRAFNRGLDRGFFRNVGFNRFHSRAIVVRNAFYGQSYGVGLGYGASYGASYSSVAVAAPICQAVAVEAYAAPVLAPVAVQYAAPVCASVAYAAPVYTAPCAVGYGLGYGGYGLGGYGAFGLSGYGFRGGFGHVGGHRGFPHH